MEKTKSEERHLVKFPTGQSAVTIKEMVEAIKKSKNPRRAFLELERECRKVLKGGIAWSKKKSSYLGDLA